MWLRNNNFILPDREPFLHIFVPIQAYRYLTSGFETMKLSKSNFKKLIISIPRLLFYEFALLNFHTSTHFNNNFKTSETCVNVIKSLVSQFKVFPIFSM